MNTSDGCTQFYSHEKLVTHKGRTRLGSYMNHALFVLIVVFLVSCTTVEVTHRAPSEKSIIDRSEALLVDTPAARLTKPYTFPVQHQTIVTCRFRLTEPYYHDDWSPALAIAFSRLGDFSNDVVGEQHVKFSALFTDATVGRQYEVRTSDNGATISTPFMRITDSKREITLSMGWHEDGYFSYRVKEKNGTSGTAAIYRPNVAPTVATVLVSGVRGYLDCDSEVMSANSDILD